MRYVAGYLLSVLGGKENPTTADLEKILGSVGIESDSEKLKKVVTELTGKKLDEVIAAGQTKLASMPAGGGAVTTSAAAAPVAAEAKKEEKKEEKKPDSEEEDDDMGFGLFD